MNYTEYQAKVEALAAVVEGGGKFYADDARLYAWSQECPAYRDHVTNKRAQAVAWEAFLIEYPYCEGGEEDCGYRLNQFCSTGGQRDIGYIFESREDFGDAMRMMRDFHQFLKLTRKGDYDRELRTRRGVSKQ